MIGDAPSLKGEGKRQHNGDEYNVESPTLLSQKLSKRKMAIIFSPGRRESGEITERRPSLGHRDELKKRLILLRRTLFYNFLQGTEPRARVSSFQIFFPLGIKVFIFTLLYSIRSNCKCFIPSFSKLASE